MEWVKEWRVSNLVWEWTELEEQIRRMLMKVKNKVEDSKEFWEISQ